MSKLTKKQKKELKKNKLANLTTLKPLESEKFSFRQILKANAVFLGFLALLILGLYYNTFDNQLTLIDDIQGFAESTIVKDLPAAIKSGHLQTIFYAISYHFFALNPLPLRIASVILHIVITFLVFIFLHILFNKKIALIAALIFALHPINTEAVTWISGMPYLLGAVEQFTCFLFYLAYEYKKSKKAIYLSAAVFLFGVTTLFNVWLLVIPVALIVLDQFFIEEKLKPQKLWWIFLFIIPLSFYLASVFRDQFALRQELREGSGNRVAVNQQTLVPVFEGWPYSLTLMAKLYIFPKDLTLYYDGAEMTTLFYVFMYVFFILYLGVTFWLWKKNRRIAGILIMLPVLVAPMLSPIKVTWFLAERYLYAGTAFFGVLVAMGYLYLEKRTVKKEILYIFLGMYLAALGARTYFRNLDWQNTRTISLANIKVAPLSVRPYNDMGSYFFFAGDIPEAIKWYEKALEVYPSSGTAMNNLGYIYFEQGPFVFRNDYVAPEPDAQKADIYYKNAIKWINNSEFRAASFLLNRAISFDPSNTEIINFTGDYYLRFEQPGYAKLLYELTLKSDPENAYALAKLAELN